MRTSYIICILFLCGITSFGQTKFIKPDEALFEQAILLEQLCEKFRNSPYSIDDITPLKDPMDHDEKIRSEYAARVRKTILNETLELYNQLIDSFPDSGLRFRALNNKASVEYQLEDYAATGKTCRAILNSEADDKEEGGPGSGLMAEPYANYKNRAAQTLAGLALMDSNYRLAIHYLDQTKKYPYRHFCGNELSANSIFMAYQYAECYIALREYDNAYRVLLPHIFNNGIAGNSYLIKIAYPALLVNYSRKELKSGLEKAFKNIRIKKFEKKGHKWETYIITYLGTTIPLPRCGLIFVKPEDKETCMQNILKGSEFYKLLQ